MDLRELLVTRIFDPEEHGATQSRESECGKNNRDPMFVATQDQDPTDEETLHDEHRRGIRDDLAGVELAAIDGVCFKGTNLCLETPWGVVQRRYITPIGYSGKMFR